MRRLLLATFALTTLATLLSGCPAEEKDDEEDGRPDTISISPVDPSVIVGSSQQLTATAHFADGSTLDVTEDTTWVSEDPSVATIDDEGVVLTLTTGESDITATYQFRVAEIELAVIPLPPPTFFESEPNDDAASADAFTDFGTFEGTCDEATDFVDYFTATFPAGTIDVSIAWVEGTYPQDLDIYIQDSTETDIGSDEGIPPNDTPANASAVLTSASNTVFVIVVCYTDAPTDYSGTLVHP